MRLIVSGAKEDQVKSALANVKIPGISVLLNPQWLTPDPDETLWVACGTDAVKQIQSAGWIPKKGGVEANRGRVFSGVHPDGWMAPINVGVTYSPQIMHTEYADFVKFQTDLALYRRFEQTGSAEAKLGYYAYVPDLSGVIAYLEKKHALTGEPVPLAFDTETEGLDPFNPEKRLVSLQFTACEGRADVVYLLGMSWAHIQERIIPQLQWIAETPWVRLIGANLKYDLLWCDQKLGVRLVDRFGFDTCNGGSLVMEDRPNTLNLHTKIYSPDLGGYDDDFNRRFDKSKMADVPKADLLPYAGGDTDACLRNYHAIRKELISDNLTASGKPARNSLASVYLNVVHPALKSIHTMERTGVLVDQEKFEAFGADLHNRMEETQKEAAAFIPKSILDKYGGLDENGLAPLSKPKMIAETLFSPQGMGLQPKMTTEATGAPSTAEFHLEQFKDHPEAGPLIERYLDYKQVSKMHGTYYEGFAKHLRSDGRWHPSYIIHKQGKDRGNEQNAGGTVTGRGSAVDPAFQCVSGETEIVTPEGIRRVADVIDPLIPDGSYNPFREHRMWIWTRNGWKQTSRVFRSWRGDRLRVVLRCGNSIVCTPEHPFRVNRQWVKARDLRTTDHISRSTTPLLRPPGPAWVTPGIAEALGVIVASAVVVATWPRLYIEVDPGVAHIVLHGIRELWPEATLDDVDDKSVISFEMAENPTHARAMFMLWMPECGGSEVPFELRGTQRIFDFFRGVWATATPQVPGAHRKQFRLRIPNKAVALALIRELQLDGQKPPSYHVSAAGTSPNDLRLSINTAAHLARQLGVSHSALDDIRPSAQTTFAGLGNCVARVEDAEPGWVYDFTVPDGSEFMANSLPVHNTVPKHSYWGKRLRECMIAPEGYVILGRDYSQGELKVTACWAGESKMINAYQNGIDLHALTSSSIKGMTYEEAMALKVADPAAYKMLRQGGKASNFGLIYGQQPPGFQVYADRVYGVKLTLEEATEMRDGFFDLYPGLVDWHDRQIFEAYTYGYVRSPLGRLRHLPTINSPVKMVASKARRQAINSPIQGTLVDLLWMAMGIIEQERPNLLTPFAQIHDQCLWYVPEDQLSEGLAYSREVMENLPLGERFGWNPPLKFTSDAEAGFNLADMEELADAA